MVVLHSGSQKKLPVTNVLAYFAATSVTKPNVLNIDTCQD